MTFFNVLWFFLIFVLILGYFVTDGFDLGAGVLSQFIAKDEREKSMVRAATGPVWDGNEVWLLTAAPCSRRSRSPMQRRSRASTWP